MTTPPLPPATDSIITERRDLVLDSARQIMPGQTKIFRVQTLRINGIHRAPETDIWLIAERIIAEDATIEVSGRDGTPSYTSIDRAVDGSSPGEAGHNAAQSKRAPPGRGGNAGKIIIVCRQLEGSLTLIANGGRGGDGLGGGNGAKGANGSPGQARATDRKYANGSMGGKGGRGGDGGDGANGGNAGAIWVMVANEQNAKVHTMATAGTPGLGGKAGVPGLGGAGGAGGAFGFVEPNEGRRSDGPPR